MKSKVFDVYKKLIEERSKAKYYSDFESGSYRRWYQHDIDTIVYSEMFRKMQRKAQLLSLYDPVARTRLIHTFEVVRIAKEISEKLGLNAELTEAIALAHDFGNVAFGKMADLFLSKKTNNKFKHEEISGLMLKYSASRLVPDKYRELAKQAIESDEKKTHIITIDQFPHQLEVYLFDNQYYFVCTSPEVIDGIEKHGTDKTAFTLEGQVVNYADNIAYLIQDISDFEASGIFDDRTSKRYSRCLNDLREKDTYGKRNQYILSDIVSTQVSTRTAVLIERYVSYNKELLKSGKYKKIKSSFLDIEIPCLEVEEYLQQAIDACWKFKDEFYKSPLIQASNIESEAQMKQLWDILNDKSKFKRRNHAYKTFEEMMDSPLFYTYKTQNRFSEEEWENWKKACFIAHLTCDEVEHINRHFLERDYVFDLSLPTLA